MSNIIDNFTLKTYISNVKISDLTTFNQQHIDITIYDLPENYAQNVKTDFWTQHMIGATINEQPAGYITLSYISDATKNKYFKDVLHYFVYMKSNSVLVSFFEDQDIEQFVIKASKFMGADIQAQLSTMNKREKVQFLNEQYKLIEQWVIEKYTPAYIGFIDYWHNKPNIDIIRVHCEKDKTSKDFSVWPFDTIQRQPLNFRKQGVAKALYIAAGKYMQSLGMCVWQSDTETPEGQKTWKDMEHYCSFKVMMDKCQCFVASGQKHLQEIERKRYIVF